VATDPPRMISMTFDRIPISRFALGWIGRAEPREQGLIGLVLRRGRRGGDDPGVAGSFVDGHAVMPERREISALSVLLYNFVSRNKCSVSALSRNKQADIPHRAGNREPRSSSSRTG